MTLVRFGNPRNGFSALPSLMETLLGTELFDKTNASAGGTSLPAVNVQETKDEFIIEVAAPGMRKEDFNIRLENNVLAISSEREESHEDQENSKKFSRREFSYQSFQRTMTLPSGVESDKINASYKDGILYVSIPKKEEMKEKPPKLIKVS